ncbi:MAG: 6-bladed beta-propeller [Bacteroides cellulosilyticus]
MFRRKGSHEQVSTVSIDKGVEHFDADYTSAQYQSLFKNPKTIRLETNDKCLLSANAYLLNVTPKYIVIGDKTSFYFFNAENGSFLSVMDRKGNGPEEYADIFSRFLMKKKS